MPKVKKRLTSEEKLRLCINSLLDEICIRNKFNKSDIAKALGISEVTLWRKRNSPKSFTILQLEHLCALSDKSFDEFILSIRR